ncbi:MAG: RlmE family RNA methyltransferase [Rhodospirillales bacterium]|nr:RlmE family RNA methyltransferase [Rhodospirillales bacterium]
MTAGGDGSPGKRRAPVKLRRARRRKPSSTRWLERQLNDPYVRAAREAGYRSRAAYKLIGLAETADILRPGQRVVDLGAAPGGWSQVAAARVGRRGRVVAVDTNAMEPIERVVVLTVDACGTGALDEIRAALGGPADLVMSDMAAPTTGHAPTDRLRVSALCESALDLAEPLLAPGGCFLAKLRQGGDSALQVRLRQAFARVRNAKPPASRADSAETYVIATGYRGKPAEPPA